MKRGLVEHAGFAKGCGRKRIHHGVMDFVDNRLNVQTGAIRARAVFDNSERRFTPGLFARIRLVGSGTYSAVLTPEQAIGTDQSKKFVDKGAATANKAFAMIAW